MDEQNINAEKLHRLNVNMKIGRLYNEIAGGHHTLEEKLQLMDDIENLYAQIQDKSTYIDSLNRKRQRIIANHQSTPDEQTKVTNKDDAGTTL